MLPLLGSDSPVWLLLCVFAAWRVTALICYDAGPFDVLTRLRRVAVAAGLFRLITCFQCTSVWVSAAVVAVMYERRWTTILVFLAVAGAVSVVERWLGGGTGGPLEDARDEVEGDSHE